MNKAMAAVALCAAGLIGAGTSLGVADLSSGAAETSESMIYPVLSSYDNSSGYYVSSSYYGSSSYTDYSSYERPTEPPLEELITWSLTEDGTLTIDRAEGAQTTPSFKTPDIPWWNRKDDVTSIVFGQSIEDVYEFPFREYPNLSSATFLNPFCNIYPEMYAIIPPGEEVTVPTYDFPTKIAGYSGSSAEITAKSYELEFEELGIFAGSQFQDYFGAAASAAVGIAPGKSATGSFGDIFVIGAVPGSAEFELVNGDELPAKVTFLSSESQEFEKSLSDYVVLDNSGSTFLNVEIAVNPDAPKGTYAAKFRCTKYTDINGNDLMPYAKDAMTVEVTFFVTENITPQPTAQPVESLTEEPEPTEMPVDSFVSAADPTEALTDAPTEPVTELPTVPATDPTEPPVLIGDLTGDSTVNASDAANVLTAAANIGAGKDSGLTPAQMKAADVNADTSINASDAAVILQYAAAVGAGQKDVTLSDFVK